MSDEKVNKLPAKKHAAARPLATVHSVNGKKTKTCLAVPDVCLAPIRADIVNFVHTNMAKNNRQAYGVKCGWGPKGVVAGHQVSAASWGTGRAVARIPRVKGGGNHRSGQGAYGNMCRGGRMFAPTKTWRKWHRKINVNQKRYAVCSAIAASCVPSLVMARGHRIQALSEVPLIVENDFESLKKTRHAVQSLRDLSLSSELQRCKKRYQRAGRGKMRNRRFRRRTGPLIVYKENKGIFQAARNIAGVDFCDVKELNLLKLAPGGHLGRLIIWTEDAWKMLDVLYGNLTKKSALKRGYQMPRPLMMNSDLDRIINSVEIQSVLKAKKKSESRLVKKKRNALKHPELMARMNPLFEQQWNELKNKYAKGSKVRTTKVLKPIRKKQRVKVQLSQEEKENMKQYWKMVCGDPVFKTRKRLEAERLAVQDAIAKAEAEKRGGAESDEDVKE